MNDANSPRKDSIVSYTRDYYGNFERYLERERTPAVRNITIFLAHWCNPDHEKGQVAGLVTHHMFLLGGPLRTLRIVLNKYCSAYRNVNTAAMEKLFSPLKGLLSKTEVQMVEFGEVLEKAAREAFEGEPETRTVVSK
jgi:hypothetical protein